MHKGRHQDIPFSMAGAVPHRPVSIFRNTLIRAASCIPPVQYTISLGAAVAIPAAVFLESSECSQFHSVLKTSV